MSKIQPNLRLHPLADGGPGASPGHAATTKGPPGGYSKSARNVQAKERLGIGSSTVLSYAGAPPRRPHSGRRPQRNAQQQAQPRELRVCRGAKRTQNTTSLQTPLPEVLPSGEQEGHKRKEWDKLFLERMRHSPVHWRATLVWKGMGRNGSGGMTGPPPFVSPPSLSLSLPSKTAH